MPETTVLHLITRYLGGGAETTTRNTIEALLEADEAYDVRLGHGASYDEDEIAAIRETGVETIRFSMIRHYNPLAAILAVGEVARYLQRERVDVLHTHSTEAGIIGRLAATIAGTPTVIHEVHGDPITSDRNPLLNQFLLHAERACATLSDVIVVKSERIRETYLSYNVGDPEQYRLIRHGVDLETYRNATPLEEFRSRRVVTYVGRLAEGKGLFDLLDAVERIDDRDFQLLVVGDGELRGELEATVRERGLDDTVTFLGYRDDVPSILAASDVLVLPSYREGTPRVITEALATGTPVIATNIAGIPDQVTDGQTGFLLNPGDIDSLSDYISIVLFSTELKNAMSTQANLEVAQYDIAEAKKSYEKLYQI